MKIFDTHLLLGRDAWLSENKPELACHSDIASASQALDDTGASEWRAATFPFPSSQDGTYIPENEAVLRAAQGDNRLLPVTAVDPSNLENLNWVMDALKGDKLRGLVIWPILCDLDLSALSVHKPLWQAVAERDIPVTVHVGVGNEPDLGRAVKANHYDAAAAIKLAQALPQVRFNLSHVLRLSAAALEALRSLDNVMMDVSGLSALNRWREAGREVFPAFDTAFPGSDPQTVLRALAADPDWQKRLMFGSSWPFNTWWEYSPKRELELLHYCLPSEMVTAIVWENPCQFYALSP